MNNITKRIFEKENYAENSNNLRHLNKSLT